jgi:Glycosyltransferase like family 2
MPSAGTATVIVPSYRRPRELTKCLEAIAAQERAPDQVVVSVFEPDRESEAAAAAFREVLPLKCVAVPDRRVLALMQAAVSRAEGEVIALTDDDAAPRPDWLGRLLAHYDDRTVGGVGGRDVLDDQATAGEGEGERVGIVRWFGRPVYGHHLGVGAARDVDLLKGANMSLRRQLWALDMDLKGAGDQPHWEFDVCLRARRAGWRLVYDPSIVVDHRLAPRVGGPQRDESDPQRVGDAAHNLLYATVRWLPWPRKLAALVYSALVGQRNAPGPLLVMERLVRGEPPGEVMRRALWAATGRMRAVRSLTAGRRDRHS